VQTSSPGFKSCRNTPFAFAFGRGGIMKTEFAAYARRVAGDQTPSPREKFAGGERGRNSSTSPHFSTYFPILAANPWKPIRGRKANLRLHLRLVLLRRQGCGSNLGERMPEIGGPDR
jgi:hypothetical protein